MKKLFLSLLIISSTLLCAQPKVSKSETFKTSNEIVIDGLAHEANTGNLFMVYKVLRITPGMIDPNIKTKWAVDVIGPDLTQISAGEPMKIEFSDGDDVEMGNLVSLGGVPAMLFYKYDKKEEKTLIYRAPLEQGGKIGPLKQLGSLDGKLKDYFYPQRVYAADSSYLLLLRPPQETRSKAPLSYLIIDSKWEVVQKGSLKFPEESGEYLLGSPMIGTDASVWMPVWTRSTNGAMPQEIWVWWQEKTEPVKVDIALSSDRMITSMVLSQSGETVYVGGLYATASKKAQKAIFNPPVPIKDDHPDQGTFIAKLTLKSNKLLSQSAQAFGESTLRLWGKDAKDFEKGEGIDLLVTQMLQPLPDGSVWVDVEEYYHEPLRQVGTRGMLTMGDEPRYGPAVAVLYDADGRVVREIQLGKRAVASVNRHASHFFYADTKGVFCLYNDHEDNVDTPVQTIKDIKTSRIANGSIRPQWIQKQACTALYYADDKDMRKLQKLFNHKETEYWVDPSTHIKLAPGIFIFACEGIGKNYGLLKVECP